MRIPLRLIFSTSAFAIISLLNPAKAQSIAPTTCDADKSANILNQSDKTDIKLNCSIKLPKNTNITRRIIIEGNEASGMTLDCNGGSIIGSTAQPQILLIRSRKDGSTWSTPHNVTVKNCKIKGSVRIYGLGVNGEATMVKASSIQSNHTQNAQAVAPSNITLNHVQIEGISAVPLYIAPGVTYTTIDQSNIKGVSSSVAIYFDAESAHNTLSNSSVTTATASRELIAIDGSAYNTITGNNFSSLNHGGIFVYRNCGEGGTVRHQKPEFNQITNNTFFYRKYKGLTPAVWLGSRFGVRSYCSMDDGYSFGSSANNSDFANQNTVSQNTFIARSPNWLIRDFGKNNAISGNTEK